MDRTDEKKHTKKEEKYINSIQSGDIDKSRKFWLNSTKLMNDFHNINIRRTLKIAKKSKAEHKTMRLIINWIKTLSHESIFDINALTSINVSSLPQSKVHSKKRKFAVTTDENDIEYIKKRNDELQTIISTQCIVIDDLKSKLGLLYKSSHHNHDVVSEFDKIKAENQLLKNQLFALKEELVNNKHDDGDDDDDNNDDDEDDDDNDNDNDCF